MSAASAVQRVLARVAQGDAVPAACASEGLAWQQDVTVDAHYDGKPVCTVTLPWVVDGHALLFADASLAASVAQERLASLAAALAMPVAIIPRAA
ncbi:MAG: hypothetical protein RL636_1837 [Verrucomicrobiota bacterium]|jgi:hypothetical protein